MSTHYILGEVTSPKLAQILGHRWVAQCGVDDSAPITIVMDLAGAVLPQTELNERSLAVPEQP